MLQQVSIEFIKECGMLDRVTIEATSKKDFKNKLNFELVKRDIDYIDYTKWNPVKSDREHKWFQ